MIKNIARSIFGGLTEPYLDYFSSLKSTLKKSGMKTRLHDYVCIIIFISFISFIASIIIGAVIITLTVSGPSYAYTLAIIVSFLVSGFVFFLGYYYPSLQAKDIQSKIDRSLPFSIFYMTTSASSGVNPLEIFRLLSIRGGKVGDEATKVYTNVKTLGMSLTSAVQKAAASTPSPTFADLLWGMSSVLTTGGDLENYLKEKTKSAMAQYVRTLNDYAKQISLYTEIYITLVIVGTLFFIILIAIIAPLAGLSILFLQAFLAFVFIPLLSLGFIVVLRSISPLE
ncbi:MAG: type II secretion system F family protein [Candidatus Aenigmatarchaeota archaeon]|nr:type II secretion system F family protein [Nanoarchaeota archaeon]